MTRGSGDDAELLNRLAAADPARQLGALSPAATAQVFAAARARGAEAPILDLTERRRTRQRLAVLTSTAAAALAATGLAFAATAPATVPAVSAALRPTSASSAVAHLPSTPLTQTPPTYVIAPTFRLEPGSPPPLVVLSPTAVPAGTAAALSAVLGGALRHVTTAHGISAWRTSTGTLTLVHGPGLSTWSYRSSTCLPTAGRASGACRTSPSSSAHTAASLAPLRHQVAMLAHRSLAGFDFTPSAWRTKQGWTTIVLRATIAGVPTDLTEAFAFTPAGSLATALGVVARVARLEAVPLLPPQDAIGTTWPRTATLGFTRGGVLPVTSAAFELTTVAHDGTVLLLPTYRLRSTARWGSVTAPAVAP